MFARNVSVHLKWKMFSDDARTFENSILPSLRKQNGMRKLILGGMLLGSLTGVCLAQHATPSARPAPSAPTVAPNAPTVAPNAPTVAPNANTMTPNAETVAPNANTMTPNAETVAPDANPVAPDANPVGPRDTVQKPPIPPNTGVSPDAVPPSPQP
jgi:hypothetical protein